ncbi:MAG TPA: sensor histidine kinase [Terriglobales bacterium]|nr:sensor histidine kinase [Terriglobales bacterium]
MSPFARLTSAVTSPAADLALGVLLTGLNVLAVTSPPGVPRGVIVLVSIAETAPVVLWRRLPVAALAVTAGAALAGSAVGLPPSLAGFAAILLSLGSTASAFGPRASIPAAVAILAGTAVVVRAGGPIGIGFNLAFVACAWSFGYNARTQRALRAALAELVASTEHARIEEARLAAADERGRLAREVHDVVAHSLSVIVVQAGAGRRVAEDVPAEVREVLSSIERTGREALGEIRRLLGVLRSGDGERTPQPGVAALPALLERFRALGLDVEADVVGGRDLPATVDLSAYRIVQEGLTNCLRHARGAAARVVVRRDAGALLVEVRNGPGGTSGVTPAGAGHGLTGMRERAVVYGGELEAGPQPGGGWLVRARLPVEPAA